MARIRVLYVGESWLGSSARSLREALCRRGDFAIDEVDEDHWVIRGGGLALRGAQRLLLPLVRREFERHVLRRVDSFRPDVFLAYKGWLVSEALLASLKSAGVLTVNVYPDFSPRAYGEQHRRTVGLYDLVISTKCNHPGLWRSLYGYKNQCVWVPHGYDPMLHLRHEPPSSFDFDVVLIATGRPQYWRLMLEFARACKKGDLRVAVGGYGWESVRGAVPRSWTFLGPLHGPAYVESLRRGRICVAPVHRHAVIGGQAEPGDEDSTRTYELAAAYCFFIHQASSLVREVYDERSEVPLFENGRDLAELVLFYLTREKQRLVMAAAAHSRAVPRYSLDARAEELIAHVRRMLRV